MRKDQLRRLKKLEACRQTGTELWLRRWAQRCNRDPETVLSAVRGHESELTPHLGEDGLITWEGFLLLRTWKVF